VIVDECQQHGICERLELWDEHDPIFFIDHLFDSQYRFLIDVKALHRDSHGLVEEP
jgi:predicted metal-dependent phosphoesterase TrpH